MYDKNPATTGVLAGRAMGVAANAPTKPESQMILDRFAASATQSNDLADRIMQLADRITGTVPMPAETGGTAQGLGYSSLSSAMTQSADAIGRNIDRAFEALARLERFA